MGFLVSNPLNTIYATGVYPTVLIAAEQSKIGFNQIRVCLLQTKHTVLALSPQTQNPGFKYLGPLSAAVRETIDPCFFIMGVVR